MSTTSLKSSGVTKRLAYSVTSLTIAALFLLLPQTQHALPLGARPAHAAVMLLRPAAMLLPGARDFWHTEGNHILDRHNRTVRISGMNWSGFETKQAVPGGLDAQDYRVILRTIKKSGYNTVRIPLSNEMVEMPAVPDHISFTHDGAAINTDLRDLNSLEILDKIVAYAGKIGLKVILDNHRSEAGSSAEESGLWYTPQFPESAWIEDWATLARRYQNTSAVIGMDLRNEPHNANAGGACWDCGGSNDWHRAAQRAGNAILAVNPRLLIFVEGVDTYAGDTYWWGGNLEGVRRSPVHLSVPNRLVYSAHEYGPVEYAQPWFDADTSTATLASVWRRHWAYISEAGIAPVWIGEFGTPNGEADVESSEPGSEGQWFTSLVAFLGSHPNLGWTYWGVNGEDRYGLLDAAYSGQPANQQKAAALASISYGAGKGTFESTITTAPASPVTSTSIPVTFRAPATVVAFPEATPNRLNASMSHQIPAHVPTESPQILKARAPLQNISTSTESAITASIHRAVSDANLNVAGAPGVASR